VSVSDIGVSQRPDNPPGQTERLAASLARRAELGELKRKRTRAALLLAAVPVLGTEGGRLATVDSVYVAAGMARGTFYNHFSGREEFIEAAAFELSHTFNCALEEALPRNASAAVRASIWIRHYLRRVRGDRQWGWALVNTSLNGRRVFGEESYNEARNTIELGCKTGMFKVGNHQAALDLALGSVLVSAMTILQEPTQPDHPEATAELVLRSLGVPGNQAQRIVNAELPELREVIGT
jgi:AcrR family transcriptional regulator